MVNPVQTIQPSVFQRLEDFQNEFSRMSEANKVSQSDNSSLARENFIEKVDRKSNKKEEKSVDNSKIKLNFGQLENLLQDIVSDDNLSLKFAMDKESNKMILKIIDNTTQEVVQQIPPEISLRIARFAASKLQNLQLANALV